MTRCGSATPSTTPAGAAFGTIGAVQIDDYPITGPASYPSLTVTGQMKALNVVAEGPAASTTVGPKIRSKFASDADPAFEVFAYDHDNVNVGYNKGSNALTVQRSCASARL